MPHRTFLTKCSKAFNIMEKPEAEGRPGISLFSWYFILI
ncbi:hypothetical protein RGAI101_174 [Roseobacter sp. GAI101]|nr:hypothetical protein RGAI101_174 [Roseobacter sp. GAI101]